MESRSYKREAKQFLSEEIRITNPKCIVFMGSKVEGLFNDLFPTIGIRTMNIGHYAYRYGSRENLRRRWNKKMSDLKRELSRQ